MGVLPCNCGSKLLSFSFRYSEKARISLAEIVCVPPELVEI